MGAVALRIVLAVGILAVTAILVYEIRSWRAGTKVVTSRQKALRVVSASLIIIIMAMVLAGDRWLAGYNPFLVLAYWTFCLGLAVALLALALFDLREVGLGYGEETKKVFRHLADKRDEDTHGE